MEVRVEGDGKEEVVKMKSVKGSGIDKNMTDEEIKKKDDGRQRRRFKAEDD